MAPAAAAERPPHAVEKWLTLPPRQLTARIQDARRRTLELVEDLSDAQWDGEASAISNPIRWEVGHVGYFYERFVLHALGRTDPLIENGYALYNSFALDRDARWEAPLPARRGTLEYLRHVTWYVLEWLEQNDPDPWETYLYLTATLHEEMHIEALTWYRQTQGCPAPLRDAIARPEAPALADAKGVARVAAAAGTLEGDAAVPGGTFHCGGTPTQPYAWDNEKWHHPVDVAPFRIARTPVTQAAFAEFVGEGGYRREELWDYEGWRWRSRNGVEQPLYWRRSGGDWERRHYERWVPLEPHAPMVHVNWYEASAYCRWAGRRLPSESEWELAATGPVYEADGTPLRKRTYPWGDAAPGPHHAHLDAGAVGCADVTAYPEGDSPFGCRQMIGNVWEWTQSSFYPYPGYVVDAPYREYSAPWFGNHRVLRGGSWATRSHLIRNTYRNFFQPDRRDIIAGFRTCAA